MGDPPHDPKKHFVNETARPVVSIVSADPDAGGPQGSAFFTIMRSGGNQSSALTVYYSVGGDLAYGTDYSLIPEPAGYPRIFSATIPATASQVTLQVSPTDLRATGLPWGTVVVKLTPYAVAPAEQVSEPLLWQYVVNVYEQAVTLRIRNLLSGLNGPVYALKVYETAVYSGETCSEIIQVIVGGQFTQAGSVAVNNVARLNLSAGTWEALGAGADGPVYAIEALERFAGDPSPDIYVGGDFAVPGSGIAKWNGASSTWSPLNVGVSSHGFLDPMRRVNTIRSMGDSLWVGGRFSHAGPVYSPNLAKWNLATSQWQTLGGQTVFPTATINGPGLASQTIMVTSIASILSDLAAVGVAQNGVDCPLCPVSQINGEAYYTATNSGTVLFAQSRSVVRAGMRALLDDVAGHDQIQVLPFASSAYETWDVNFSGLSQFTMPVYDGDDKDFGGWQLIGFGGAALNNQGPNPYWPVITTVPSGWKTIGPVNALARYGDDWYIGGSFNTLSGASAGQQVADYSPLANVFKWNESTGWSTLANSPGVPCILPGAIGVNGPVNAMDVEYSICDNQFLGLWVGGNFSQAGGGSVGNIAFWTWAGPPTSRLYYWDVPATPTILAPANGAVMLPPANVAVAASFPATGCNVTKVEYYEGNTLLASPAYPFSFTWNAAPPGTHTIRAVATDSTGRVGVSEAVTFRVDAAPLVELTSPANGSVFAAPVNITIAASATDRDGAVTQVQFYANGNLIGTDGLAPYSMVWNNVQPGTYSIIAKATDTDGAQTTAPASSIIVQ